MTASRPTMWSAIAFLLVGLQIGFGAASQSANSGSSESPAAQQLRAWLQAYNSGSRSDLAAFYARNFPARQATVDDDIQRRRNLTGGYDLEKVEECNVSTCSAILKMRDLEEYVRVKITVEDAAPHRIVALDGEPIPRPAEFPSPRVSQDDAVAALNRKLDEECKADRFSGAVLIANHGSPKLSQACNFADRDARIPNALDTRFRIGSMNKIFTAVAVLQLAEAGKIRLDDPIGKYIPDYPNTDLAARVKIKHLLTHTGGTGDIFGPEYDSHRNELRTLEDYVKLYGKRPLEFEPGTRRVYSNYGFVLLGVVIERVSKQSYYDYVRDHIYRPAGMSRTGSEPEDVLVAGRAVAYTRAEPDSPWMPDRDNLPYRGSSAGGGYSTVEDLLNFSNALLSHKLLSAKFLDLLIQGEPLEPGGRSYPFGSGGRTWDGVRYFGHNGGYPGMNGDLEMSPQAGYTIVVLSNFDPPAAQRISEFIGSRLPAAAPH